MMFKINFIVSRFYILICFEFMDLVVTITWFQVYTACNSLRTKDTPGHVRFQANLFFMSSASTTIS